MVIKASRDTHYTFRHLYIRNGSYWFSFIRWMLGFLAEVIGGALLMT